MRKNTDDNVHHFSSFRDVYSISAASEMFTEQTLHFERTFRKEHAPNSKVMAKT